MHSDSSILAYAKGSILIGMNKSVQKDIYEK